jgi:hypothetical protein
MTGKFGLALYDGARKALAEVVRIDEVKHIRDMAVAAQTYARQAQDRALINDATAVRERAERRAGEILTTMKAKGERHSGHGDQTKRSNRQATPQLDDLRVTKIQSSRWQKKAAMSEPAFEAHVAKVQSRAVAAIEDAPRPDKAAQRGQPARDGPDFWPTPVGLIAAACKHIVPVLPAGVIWECACGDGVLQRAIAACGRKTIGTDRYPQRGVQALDFLTDEPPARDLVAMTNGPFNELDGFINRGLELLDAGWLRGFVLLLRHDHLIAGSRVEALNRATWEIHLNWRPVWIADSEGNPRWAFSWIYWGSGRRRAPLYLRQDG